MSIYCPESCDCADCAKLERLFIRLLFILLVAVALLGVFGCAANKKPQIVYVPAQCPTPPVIPRPHLPMADLKPDSTPDDVARACLASVELLKGYSKQLEELLKAYNKPGA